MNLQLPMINVDQIINVNTIAFASMRPQQDVAATKYMYDAKRIKVVVSQ